MGISMVEIARHLGMGGIGDCDGDSKGGGGEMILMLLSNVPKKVS
jgi:hypothetical protein